VTSRAEVPLRSAWGTPAIQAVVDDFIGNVAADARIDQRFARANIPV
jgi:hypothetical protein